MSATTHKDCPLGLTSQVISAWRSHALRAAEEQHIAAHVTTCPACQAHLQAYDTINQQIRTQKIPAWEADVHDLQRRTRTGKRTRQRHFSLRSPWSTLIAVAAVLAIVFSFQQLLFSHSTTSLQSESPRLAWQRATLPTALAQSYTQVSWRDLSISAADGVSIYGCGIVSTPQGGTTAVVWKTSDRGVHWTQTPSLPVTRSNPQLCYATVDDLDPTIALVTVGWPTLGQQRLFSSEEAEVFSTYDSGKSWFQLLFPQAYRIAQLATWNGATFISLNEGTGAESTLLLSTDRMRNWEPIDQVLRATKQLVKSFTVNPVNGELIAQIGKEGEATRELWSSTDNGKDWVHLNTPPGAITYFISPTASATRWIMCAQTYPISATPSIPNGLWCSDDEGVQWSKKPLPTGPVTIQSPNGAERHTVIGSGYVIAATPDGSLIAVDSSPAKRVLYRLPSGSTQWQFLGELAVAGQLHVRFVGSTGEGYLWTYDLTKGADTLEQTAFSAPYQPITK